MDKSSIFVTVILFWFLLFTVFGVIGYSIEQSTQVKECEDYYNGVCDYSHAGEEFTQGITEFNILSIGSALLFIFKVMFFQVPISYGIPIWLGIMLDTMAIFSIYVIVVWLRGS